MKNNQPNIVFYFSDQQRWDTLGCYGQKLPVTPVLDKLAEDGTLFENTFTCQPVCGPTRACLQSGEFATSTGAFVNGIALPRDRKMLADYLNDSGYETAYVGKWHLASDSQHDYKREPIPLEYRGGYKDYWMAADVLEFVSHGYNGHVFDIDNKKVDFIGYRPDCINNYAIDYLHKHNPDKPFFLMISQIEPHHQNDQNRYEGPDGSKKRFCDYEAPGDLVGTDGDWRENYPDYLGQCNSLDQNVGRMIDTLKEMNLWDNTIFIYTSDHGSHFRTRNREYKRSCHDGCTHVPLIIHGGAFSGGRRISEMTSLIDLPATILDCIGAEIPEHFKGQSLIPLVQGKTNNWTDDVFIQISESQVGRAVRTHDYKYSVYAPDKNGKHDMNSEIYVEQFLYDLKADPHERNNLVADPNYEDVRSNMRARLLSRIEMAGEVVPIILPLQK